MTYARQDTRPESAASGTPPRAGGGWDVRRFRSALSQAVGWTVIVVVGAALAVTVVIPRIAGATPYTVLSSSMEPGLSPGTMVVIRPVDPDDIGVGAVITYQLRSGDGDVVTHRVVGVGRDGTNAVRLQTQGDANDRPDPELVRPVQVRGELWYSVPWLGYLNTILTGDQRHLAVLLVALGLFVYAATMFGSAAVTRLRREKMP